MVELFKEPVHEHGAFEAQVDQCVSDADAYPHPHSDRDDLSYFGSSYGYSNLEPECQRDAHTYTYRDPIHGLSLSTPGTKPGSDL